MELLIAVGFFGLISGIVYFVVASRAPIGDEVIQQRLQNPLASELLRGEYPPGSTIRIDAHGDEFVFSRVEAPSPQPAGPGRT